VVRSGYELLSFSVGASLLAMAAYEPTSFLQTACDPCGSELGPGGDPTKAVCQSTAKEQSNIRLFGA